VGLAFPCRPGRFLAPHAEGYCSRKRDREPNRGLRRLPGSDDSCGRFAQPLAKALKHIRDETQTLESPLPWPPSPSDGEGGTGERRLPELTTVMRARLHKRKGSFRHHHGRWQGRTLLAGEPEKTPKQLITLLGNRSLLQQAVTAVPALASIKNIFGHHQRRAGAGGPQATAETGRKKILSQNRWPRHLRCGHPWGRAGGRPFNHRGDGGAAG